MELGCNKYSKSSSALFGTCQTGFELRGMGKMLLGKVRSFDADQNIGFPFS